jgi:ATP-dependent Clp protease ATP-binding subunit ClpB
VIKQITPEEFTEMSWEGVLGALESARLSKQQIVESEHLMKALLEQKDGLARRIFSKAGIDNTTVLQATDDFISRQPKVQALAVIVKFYKMLYFQNLNIIRALALAGYW